jgi:mevalonate kinase
MQQREDFYSKILLFGEYALMAGSPALSIPYPELHGSFAFQATKPASGEFDSNSHLKKYVAYLRKLFGSNPATLDISRFENDIAKGLIFQSNIPLGYGLGSSGALVAAVYARYAGPKVLQEEVSAGHLKELKQHFAAMESWFHGKSSGLDPLICYLRKAVVVTKDSTLKTVDLPVFETDGKGAIFLLDTGMTGETQPLVNHFVEQCKAESFLERIKTELIPLNNRCIRSYLSADKEELLVSLAKLSAFTLRHFRPMIPEKVIPAWEEGLSSGNYSLKLCGSGGGGMMLGFTRHFEKAQNALKSFPLKIVQQL